MLDGQYGCIFTLHFLMISGDGPKARELLAQSSSLHTLVGLGDRQVANMAAARADAVDAAPESMAHALRADAAPMQDVADDAIARKRKRDAEMAKLDAEVAEYKVRHEQCLLHHEEIGVRRRELKVRGVEVDAKMEAAQQALEEARQKRRLAEAEAKQKAQLQEARQDTQLRVDVEAGVISEEAASRLQPRRIEVRMEKYVESCLEASLSQYKAKLCSMNKTVSSLAQELGKRAKTELLNRTRFLAKPRGDRDGNRVLWYEEDCPELYEIAEEILKAWCAPPRGQTTLRLQ